MDTLWLYSAGLVSSLSNPGSTLITVIKPSESIEIIHNVFCRQVSGLKHDPTHVTPNRLP